MEVSEYGQVMANGLDALFTTVEDKFTPHSVHCFFNSPPTDKKALNWQTERISQGNNFVNRSCAGVAESKAIGCFINGSFTTRNSYDNSLQKYIKYQEMIAQRRAEGKTEDDDEDDDIRPVEVPFKFQVPFPSSLKDLPLNQLALLNSSTITVKLPPGGGVEVGGENPIAFFAKLNGPVPENKFVALCQLSDVADVLTYKNCQWSVQEREMYFHDGDFRVDNYLAFQARVLSKKHGTLLVELEVFNLNGIQVSTIIQEAFITSPRL